MGMDNDISHKFTHKFILITTIYDQLPNEPLMPLMGRGMSLINNANFVDNLAKMRFFKKS